VEFEGGALTLNWAMPFVMLLVGREAVTVGGSEALGEGLAANASPGVGADS
jgi:hypothetical protein